MATSTVKIIDIDRGWKKMIEQAKTAGTTEVKVGLFGSGNPPDNLAALGAIHDLGRRDDHIRSRPFMRQAFAYNKKELGNISGKLIRKVLQGKTTPKKVLGDLGKWFSKKIQEEIQKGNFRYLADSTIRKKGHSRKLIDTGQMYRGITYRVGKKSAFK